jgi:hypothetical protein
MEKSIHFPLLRERVEARFGLPANSSQKFNSLSKDILARTGESLSASTLKRFWGYVTSDTAPSLASLDILSRYAGYPSFKAFCAGDASQFLTAEELSSKSLKEGAEVEIRWDPGRIVRLRHLDGSSFIVTASEKSKLRVGDSFEVADFIVGFPLYIGQIVRNGVQLPAYVAGSTGGLTACMVI